MGFREIGREPYIWFTSIQVFPVAPTGSCPYLHTPHVPMACAFPPKSIFLLPFTCDPVYCDALHTANAISHHILSPCLVTLGPANGAQAHIHPINSIVFWKQRDRYENAPQCRGTARQGGQTTWEVRIALSGGWRCRVLSWKWEAAGRGEAAATDSTGSPSRT